MDSYLLLVEMGDASYDIERERDAFADFSTSFVKAMRDIQNGSVDRDVTDNVAGRILRVELLRRYSLFYIGPQSCQHEQLRTFIGRVFHMVHF